MIKTTEDIVKVSEATELEKDQNKIFNEQFKQMNHNNEGMPQVFISYNLLIMIIFIRL